MKRLFVCAALACVAVSLDAVSASAQIGGFRNAASKIEGELGLHHRSAYRSVSHARDYAYDYGTYGSTSSEIATEPATAHSEGIKHNIDTAKKHYAKAKKAHAADKDTVAALDAILEHLAAAEKAHEKLHATSTKGEIDEATAKKEIEAVTAELEKAVKAHEDLVKKLSEKKS
ncbi:MAG: hypothetical protein AB7O68_08390 [Pirellulales bacterium]